MNFCEDKYLNLLSLYYIYTILKHNSQSVLNKKNYFTFFKLDALAYFRRFYDIIVNTYFKN